MPRHDLERGVIDVHRETPARPEVMTHTCETREPIRFGDVVQKRPERRDDQREPLGQVEASHVAADHVYPLSDVGSAGLPLTLESAEHLVARIQCMDRHTSARDWQCDATGSRSQFQHRAAALCSFAAVPLNIAL